MTEVTRGQYSRVEAIEGAGKTTQIDLAKQYALANNLNVLFIREPGATPFGQQMRFLLQEDESVNLSPKVEQMLYTADRLYTIDELILPALERGQDVEGDRGRESGRGYQAGGGGLSLEFIDDFDNLVLPQWYREARVAYLRISRETQQKRMAQRVLTQKLDKIERRPKEYFDRVYQTYEQLPGRPNVTVIDAEGTPEETFEQYRPFVFGPEHA